MTIEEATRNKLSWGRLRLLLGFAQMSLAATSPGLLVTVGLHWVTWAAVAAATTAAIISRLRYGAKASPVSLTRVAL